MAQYNFKMLKYKKRNGVGNSQRTVYFQRTLILLAIFSLGCSESSNIIDTEYAEGYDASIVIN